MCLLACGNETTTVNTAKEAQKITEKKTDRPTKQATTQNHVSKPKKLSVNKDSIIAVIDVLVDQIEEYEEYIMNEKELTCSKDGGMASVYKKDGQLVMNELFTQKGTGCTLIQTAYYKNNILCLVLQEDCCKLPSSAIAEDVEKCTYVSHYISGNTVISETVVDDPSMPDQKEGVVIGAMSAAKLQAFAQIITAYNKGTATCEALIERKKSLQ